jgi:hypothetical protein
MSTSDWLVPLDDELCARLRTCTGCGARCRGSGWFDVWRGVDLAVAFLLCERCHADAAARAGVERLMHARYGSLGEH